MTKDRYSDIPSLQPRLFAQIAGIQKALAAIEFPRLTGVILFGSASRGQATYRSDVDLLFILNATSLNSTNVRETRDFVEAHFARLGQSDLLEEPLEVQVTVVLESVFDTKEPEMRKAVGEGTILFDPKGALAIRIATAGGAAR